MPPLSTTPAERARKIHSTILQAVQRDATQVAVAAAMGSSESTVSRLLSDHLEKLCLVLAHAGLKVVPAEMQCFPPDMVNALLTLAKDRLASVEHPNELIWD